MIFLPIVERELRSAARRPATYLGRTATALAAVVVWLWAAASGLAGLFASRSGAWLFDILSFVAFAFALAAGLRGTSDCLSREKREGTLGLLFLTDLKGYDVVLGKLAATSLGALYGMLAVFPVLAIPLLMGGVTAAAFWHVVLVLLNTLFFSLASGVFVSAISRHERLALGGTLLVLLIFAGGLPLVGYFISQFRGSGATARSFLFPSPGFAFFLATSSSALGVWRGAEFWGCLLTTHLLGWSLLGLASWIVPHAWKDRPATVKRLRWRAWWRDLVQGNDERRRAFRTRLLEINPIFWLSSRERQTASYPWIFLLSMGAIMVWAWTIGGGILLEPGLALALTFALHAFMKYWLLTLACHSFATDRDNGALELLLSTPLTVHELLRGQFLALRRQFGLPIAAILLLDVCWLGCGAVTGLDKVNGHNYDATWLWAFLANMAMFATDVLALAWVGMWMGVSVKTPSHAVFAAMLRVLILPWLILALVLVMMVFIPLTRLFPLVPGEGLVPMLWLFIGLGIDFVYGRRAYLSLHLELRSAATQRFSAASPERRGAGSD